MASRLSTGALGRWGVPSKRWTWTSSYCPARQRARAATNVKSTTLRAFLAPNLFEIPWVNINTMFFWNPLPGNFWRFTTCVHVETQQDLILQDPRIILHKIFRAGFVLTIFNLFVSSRVLSPNHEKVMKHYLQLGSFMETTINHKLSTSPLLMVTYGDRPHHWISVVKRCLDSPSAAASRERSETMFVLMHQSCLVRS
jgi:hypothetical protein